MTLAAQLGRIFNNTNSNDRYYLSMDIYYWGAEYLWYARGATRPAKNYKEYTIEGYRTLFANALPVIYVGATRNDLGTKKRLGKHTIPRPFSKRGGIVTQRLKAAI